MIWLLREVIGITNAWVALWMPHALAGFVKGDTICKLIATVFAIAVNYLGNRLFVFSKKADDRAQSKAAEAEKTA